MNEINLDISPGYLIEPKVASRIAKYVPNAHFVCLFRDPVKRAHAHYHYLKAGKIDLDYSFGELVETQSLDHKGRWNILNHGFYAKNLKPFIEKFGLDKFHFIFMEDIKNKPNEVLEKFFSFVNINSSFCLHGIHEKVNAARALKSRKLYWLKYNFANYLERSGLSSLRKGKKTGIPKLLESFNSATIEKPKLQKLQKNKLLDIYEEDTAKLSRIVNRDLIEIWLCK